jgi:hypothetical protein
MDISRSIDIENIVRLALTDYFTIYCRPLPEKFETPSLLVSLVGGSDANTIDSFDIVLDSRAKSDAEANELLRTAIGALKQIAKEQTTALRYVEVNSSGSWGNDPVRPDLAMCSARLRIVAHQEKITINRR